MTGFVSALRLGAVVFALCLLGCQRQSQELGSTTSDGRLSPLLENMGNLHREVTTADEMAQRYFDQGLTLLYGFNHAEASRSFQEVARIDPDCVMAYWGQALAEGPNINDPAPPAEREQAAYKAIQEGLKRRGSGSEKEQELVVALSARFSPNAGEDRETLNAAYANAMAKVFAQYQDDPDIAVLYADAVMNTTPWDYWLKDGTPKPGTEKVVPTLESAIASHPNHPGARHFYIHAVEASKDPDRAEESADVLGGLVPGAGHLVHMPAHIYIRVGRYADASDANVRAIAADEDYLTQCRSQGIYPAAYYPHNIHFMTATLAMEGRSVEMLAAARKVAAHHTDESITEQPDFAFPHLLRTIPMSAMVRFGKWDEILQEPEPAEALIYARSIWHYARGLACAAKGDLGQADSELAAMEPLVQREELQKLQVWELNSLADLAEIGKNVLAGEIAAKRKAYDSAVASLRKAVEIEDSLGYSEPPDWPIPARQNLGAVLLEAGQYAEAERVYKEDLERHRNNGWALAGLRRCLEAQGRTQEAEQAQAAFDKVWARADVRLETSRY